MEDEMKQQRMRELVELLQQASKAYYAEDREIISNFEYDRYYDELEQLEKETGVVLAGSPTVSVGYESVEELPKEAHEKPMLSLGKTKDRQELQTWLQAKEALQSWKLDGLTVVLTYQNGQLVKAVTRGNGEVGEVITANAKVFKNIPLQIAYKGELILRGEAVISYADFEKVNAQIEDADAKYKNPRNLCSGSVRQLNNKITAERNVRFYAFALVKAEDVDFQNSRKQQFLFLENQGFDVVEYKMVTEDNLQDTISYFEEKIKTYEIPSDGLVLTYEDIAYGESLGMTAKFPRNAIAFKWQDEIRETTLLEMEWSPSRTGLINPVAIFEPVELEGTTVSRASVHNVSILRSLKLGIGDKITVYKANMIIPQIADNLTKSDTLEIPGICPACGGETESRQVKEVVALYCRNHFGAAKKIKSFAHFVARDAMNIEGLSEATLEKFIGKGFIHTYTDIYHLDQFKEQIVEMEGFGEKSYQKLISSIEKSRKTTLPKLLYSLGIANVGLSGAKLLCKQYQDNLDELLLADAEQLSQINGVGEVIAGAFCDFFAVESNRKLLEDLRKELQVESAAQVMAEGPSLEGKVFVITGSLNHFENRNAMKDVIEAAGGKVTGSVTKKTTVLINNDITSSSSKNKTAKELGIPILTEEEFMQQYL